MKLDGDACEQLGRERPDLDWRLLIVQLLAEEVRFSRVDTAFDDIHGSLSLRVIEACLDARHYTTHIRVSNGHPRRDLRSGVKTDTGITFGSKTSESTIRVYDRALLLGQARSQLRVELQSRGRRAQTIVTIIAERGPAAIAGVVRQLLDFKTKGKHRQKSRWPPAPWWAAFLGEWERVPLGVAHIGTGEPRRAWFERCVVPFGVRLDASHGPGTAALWLAEGMERLQSRRAGSTRSTR